MNPKKQQIIKAAYSLFIQKGFLATSIQDILDESRVSKGTFYNYFSSKSECLMAILDSIGNEIQEKRIAAMEGQSLSDLQVLANQIAIRIQMSREKNLFSLYESIFYSQDEELRTFSKQQYLKELKWISERIVDVFGEQAAPYALEASGSIYGTIQQMMHLWKLTSDTELPIEELAEYTLRRAEASLKDQIEVKDRFLPEHHDATNGLKSREELRRLLQNQLDQMPADDPAKQLVAFLYEELAVKDSRKALISSVLSTLASDSAIQPELLAQLERANNSSNGSQR